MIYQLEDSRVLKFFIMKNNGCSESECSSHSQTILILIIAGLHTSNIPHVEFKSIVHEGFDIEALCGHDM